MNKICTQCKKDLPLSEYNKLRMASDGLSYRCRSCNSENGKAYYKTHSGELKPRCWARKQEVRAIGRAWVTAYLQAHPCPCGEARTCCLDFDHIDPKTKRDNVSSMVSDGCSVEVIQAEVQKTQVLCSNCHRIKTARDYGWYSDKT